MYITSLLQVLSSFRSGLVATSCAVEPLRTYIIEKVLENLIEVLVYFVDTLVALHSALEWGYWGL